MQLQKEMNLIQNSPIVKKVCGPQESHCEKKDVKSKVAAKKMAVMVGWRQKF